MNTQESITYLENFQRWRSGEDGRTLEEVGLSPAQTTTAMNAVIAFAKSAHGKPCPNVVGGTEGSQYCALAESSVAKLTDQRDAADAVVKSLRAVLKDCGDGADFAHERIEKLNQKLAQGNDRIAALEAACEQMAYALAQKPQASAYSTSLWDAYKGARKAGA